MKEFDYSLVKNPEYFKDGRMELTPIISLMQTWKRLPQVRLLTATA